jgi:uncharacterized paraquat-inducible protein A
MTAITVQEASTIGEREDLVNCDCGQALESCHSQHCPRCGVALHH